MVSSPQIPNPNPNSPPPWIIELLYDGLCPLCMREVNFLRRRDGDRGRIAFVDVAADDYCAADHGGIDFETAMGRIHALRADGTVLRNVEVFREIYTVLGLGWVYGVTRLPGVGALADWVYGLWADRRLAVTGRPDLATLVAQRQQRLGCDGDRCRAD
ncbi:thiol-disulfide oxidoreductase DCC family protein [Prochlorothrix hollandica]|uniref:Thiol-disulfide oxidoreductase n=1 Tax=Prochlorothrix hollandica PCC 9006 = CALU 1027 TaxID=317619 RepID=A0A0M2Q1M6_PROHO|nr:DUF393 domain-containing protein [Prochlorothrix hollandica]KKJ01208.1 thiol-disulfide oxidoreductase [Prochlorothrix hollandica PCC 9006 = CALU 1027]